MTTGMLVRGATGALLLLALWGLVACGGDGGLTPSASALPRSPIATATATATTAATATSVATATSAATAVPASPPPGGPPPTVLIGTWTRVVSTADSGAVVTFSADGFRVADKLGGGIGDVVVNGDEIDFFNVQACGLFLPEGVGRYRWTLHGATLHFAPLNSDPCPVRHAHFADQDFTRSGG